METSEVVSAIADAENQHDWVRLAELFDEQVTIVHPGIGPVVGRDANISVMKFIIGAIEGYTRTTEGLVVDGDRGAFRFAIVGVHAGDLPGYRSTGEAVDISGAMFFRVSDERLIEATEILNHDSTRRLSLR